MTSAVVPAGWSVPSERGIAVSAVLTAVLLSMFGFVIAAFGFALPMTLRLIDSGRAIGRPEDLVLLRSLAPDGSLIVTVGVFHAIVGLGVLVGLRAARIAATVLAGAGLIVGSLSFASVVSGQGPMAQVGLGNPGSGRLDGIGISLAAILFEVVVLFTVAAAGRRAAIDR
jgi:hypothetical protein